MFMKEISGEDLDKYHVLMVLPKEYPLLAFPTGEVLFFIKLSVCFFLGIKNITCYRGLRRGRV